MPVEQDSPRHWVVYCGPALATIVERLVGVPEGSSTPDLNHVLLSLTMRSVFLPMTTSSL